MKAVLSCIILLACVTLTNAQTKTAVEKLQQVYTQRVAWNDAGNLTYDEQAKVISVKNYQIPVSENTRVRVEKNSAHFFMQQGTAVTDIHDSTWRRAEFEIPFKDKKSAAEFVRYFESLKE